VYRAVDDRPDLATPGIKEALCASATGARSADPFIPENHKIRAESVMQLVTLLITSAISELNSMDSSRASSSSRGSKKRDDRQCLPGKPHIVAESARSTGNPTGVLIKYRCRSINSPYPAQKFFPSMSEAQKGVPPGTENRLEEIMDQNMALYSLDARGNTIIEKRLPCTSQYRATTTAGRRADSDRGESTVCSR
jgi:hypothetical protein